MTEYVDGVRAELPTFDSRHYVPLLKGRVGELDALSHISPAVAAAMTPLLEVVPAAVDDDDPDSVELALTRFTERLARRWTDGGRVLVDVGLLPADVPLSRGRMAAQYLEDDLTQRGVTSAPVVRLGYGPVLQRQLRELIERAGRGAAVRVTIDDFDSEVPLDEALTDLLRELHLDVRQTDLIIDFGSVRDQDRITLSVQLARYALRGLPDLAGWRTFTIAAGAFPSELTAVPPNTVYPLPRLDVALYRRLTERASLPRTPGFGDYAIAHPLMPTGPGFAPAPQLRYTDDEDWLVLKGRKATRRGSRQFYDLCAQLVESGRFKGGELSWGDDYIGQAARSAPDDAEALVGTGNATTWRSLGTSHHLALVVSRLATLGAP